MSSNAGRIAALAVIFATLAGISGTSRAVSAPSTANANVVQPIAITAGQTLEFGTFTGAAGTVTVSTAGTRSFTGSVLLLPGIARQGTFNVTGSGNSTFAITYPAPFNISNGSNTMSVTVAGPATGTLSSGTATIEVGGTVSVSNGQAPGSYTGNYTMTVEYN